MKTFSLNASNEDLRWKIDESKRRLPLSALMRQLGYNEKHIGKTAHCPFHSDEHKSFSVFHGTGGKGWQWKCHTGCGSGDEIAFLVKQRSLSTPEAIRLYLDMAGFPPSGSPKSHEYRKSLRSPGSPKYPVSNGQRLEEELEELAARNACTEHGTARKKRWQLVRDLRAVEKRIARELNIRELMTVFDEWYRLSHPFLDPAKTREAYLAMFLAELRKVRVPTGEGDTLNKALEAVSKLSDSELPAIPGLPDAPENLRRVAALHRELSRRSGGNTYFLSCRDAAKASSGLSHQTAYNINLALGRLGVIKIVRVGDPHPNGPASEFRYLLSRSENADAEIAA
jgi:hypothetical protein